MEKTILIIKHPNTDSEIHIKEDAYIIGRGRGLFRVNKELIDEWAK
jgi:hypothetical protein